MDESLDAEPAPATEPASESYAAPADGTGSASSAILRFDVDGPLAARDMADLCSAVRRMYDALRVARIARPDSQPPEASTGYIATPPEASTGVHETPAAEAAPPMPTAAESERDLAFVSENLSLLAPESELVIASVAIASPGDINFTGSGEIVEKTADFLQRIYTRGEIKRGAHLDNEAREVAIDRERLALSRERGAGDVELSMTRYRALKEVFVDLHGPSILETDAGRALFREVLSGVGSLDVLAAAGTIRLPPT